MNLVQLQDDLRMLPLPALQAKAQGQDPNTPPWLAAAVLNERMTAQQKAGMAQGAAQGPQPSVIEQMQQKAGLMALQAQQQQQAQQQMMNQMAQAPQAVPQGVPQPEAQPQMMAGGGIARLPINPQMFNYRQGGVIGFADGGETGANLDAVKERAEQAIAKLRSYGLNQQKQDPQGYQQAQKEAAEAQQAVKDAMTTYQAELQQSGMNKPYFGTPKPTTAPLQGGKPMPESQGIGSIFVPGGQSGLRPEAVQAPASPAPRPTPRPASQAAPMPAAATQPATPPATPPQPAQAGVTTLPSGFEQSLTQGIERAKAEQGMTPEQAKARYEATMSDELRKPAGLEQLARLKQQQEQYAKSQEDRPYERLMKVLGAAGRGGMGGFGSGYLGAVEGERAADAAQAAYQDKVMTAVEATRRGEATAKQKAMLDMIEKGDERKAQAISYQIQGSSSGYSTAQTAKTAEKQIAANETIHRLDRELREKLHKTPPAQRASIEENAIQSLMKEGKLSYSEAFAKVKQISSGFKGEITLDQATDNVQKYLESSVGMKHVREIQQKAKEANKPVPDIGTIRKQLIQQEMSGSGRPTQSNSSLLSAADKIVSGGK